MEEPTCPKCGGPSGYYDLSVQRHVQSTDFKHEPFNCEVEFIRGGTRKYCCDCHKDITDFVAGLKNELGTYRN